jgi:hypothetical protein
MAAMALALAMARSIGVMARRVSISRDNAACVDKPR